MNIELGPAPLSPAAMSPTQTTTLAVYSLRDGDRVALDDRNDWATVVGQAVPDETDRVWLLSLAGEPTPRRFPFVVDAQPEDVAVRVLVDEAVRRALDTAANVERAKTAQI